jgi:hypothetical protein
MGYKEIEKAVKEFNEQYKIFVSNRTKMSESRINYYDDTQEKNLNDLVYEIFGNTIQILKNVLTQNKILENSPFGVKDSMKMIVSRLEKLIWENAFY